MINYFILFEIIEISNIKINIIKIEESETYIFQTIIHFNSFGTEDISPADALQTISFLINNFIFSINEELNKITLIINSKNKALIELLLYKDNKDNIQSTKKIEYINNTQNKIKIPLNIISNQKQRINELRNREENSKNLIKLVKIQVISLNSLIMKAKIIIIITTEIINIITIITHTIINSIIILEIIELIQ